METVTASRSVRANGIDIHYVEQGEGEPLLLLHGGMVSSSSIWAGVPVSYASHLETLAERFRVIAPDTRGCARTAHTGGPISYALLADDVAALIEALELDHPLVAGFSDGGIIATILGIRRPGTLRAIVNDAGYDFFNPESASFPKMRAILGGSPDATGADPDAVERSFAQAPRPMQEIFELMKTDQDSAQGEGYWRAYLERSFDRTTQWPGWAFEDLRTIDAPTLILVGDRDEFCCVEEAVTAYRSLPNGELAIVPNTSHVITVAKVNAMIEFLDRHRSR